MKASGALPLLGLPRDPQRECYWIIGLAYINLLAPRNGFIALWQVAAQSFLLMWRMRMTLGLVVLPWCGGPFQDRAMSSSNSTAMPQTPICDPYRPRCFL
jgi:hypothetical protein